MGSFEIKIIRQYWIKDDGKDDKEDLCSHGEVFIQIGEEILSDYGSLTATGLYLLRTLEMDYVIDQFASQLVPCCGHFWIPDENGEDYVVIVGCQSGVDWTITHKNQTVIFESEKGSIGKLSFDEYKNMVLKFTDEIEQFYGNSDDKKVPNDEFEQKGFKQFWNEWKTLKNKWLLE